VLAEVTDTEKVFLDEVWNEIEQTEPIIDEADETEGFTGTGLLVSPDGELAIVICDGGLETVQVFRTSDTEAGALAAMINAVGI
jgi:hypothetical protein